MEIGNIFFDEEEKTATKFLRNTSSKEKIDRFKLEQKVLKELAKEQIPNIVEVIEVYADANIDDSYIKMKKYDGALADLFEQTKGNTKFSLTLILPIINALKMLSERQPPIYHRDLKPDNILYKKTSNGYELYLTDFGTCFFENGENRITQDNIAVGARMFIAPEYEVGKVEEINEKGDIFSIGKIIWCMINGEENALLPSNFWFINDYDLSKKFINDKDIISANIIISSCLNINPNERCDYNELIKLITNVLDENHGKHVDEKQLKVRQFQEKRKIELVEILKRNKMLVNNFSIVLINGLKELINTYPEFYILERIYTNYLKKTTDGVDFTTINIDNNSAHYLYSSSFDNMYISINYNPAGRGEKYANITMDYHINSNQKSGSMRIKYNEKGIIVCEYNNNINMLSENQIINFFDNLIMDYIE